MEYKLNPQHIADLAAGKVILAYTKKEEDLPLLMAIINKASKKKVVIKEPFSSYIFFRTGDLITRNTMPIVIFPIIPLHDFLAKDELPKEDLDRIDLMDKRLKEMESLLDTALSNETPETLKEWLLAKRAKAEIAEPKINWLTRVRLDVYNEYDILVYTNTPKLTKDQADQTADLIKWVLDNQETVLKLKNNDK
jgi:hypothetical protein